MKKLSSLLVAGALVSLTGAGTAAAEANTAKTAQNVTQVQHQATAPSGKAAATNSRLYKTGLLADPNCRPGEIPRGKTAAYRQFLAQVTDCLNRTWATQFRKARLKFSKPRLRIITGKVNTPCGRWGAGAKGIYCSANRTMYMLITKTDLRRPNPLGITHLMAHEYGHHVQMLAGILRYRDVASYRARKSVQLLLSRRLELQAECFAATFMSTVRETLPIHPDHWKGTVQWVRENGHKAWRNNDHGKGPTQAFWMERGYSSGSPSSCNTWRVSSRYVT